MLQEEVRLRNVAEKLLEERCDKLDLALATIQANGMQPSRDGGVQHRLDCLEAAIRETIERVTNEVELVRQGLGPLRDLPRKLQDVNHMLQEEVQIRTNCERQLQERCDHVEEAVNAGGMSKDIQAKVNDLKSDATTAHQRIDCLEAIIEEAHSRFTKDLQGFSNQLIQNQPLPGFQQVNPTHQQQVVSPPPEFKQVVPTRQQQAPPEFHQPGPEKQQQQHMPPEFQQPIQNQQPLKMQRELHQQPFNQQPPQELLRQCSAPRVLDAHVMEATAVPPAMLAAVQCGQELVPVNGLPPQVPRTIAVHRSPSTKTRLREVREVRVPSPVRQMSASPVQPMLQQQVGRQQASQSMALPCDAMTGHGAPEVRYVL